MRGSNKRQFLNLWIRVNFSKPFLRVPRTLAIRASDHNILQLKNISLQLHDYIISKLDCFEQKAIEALCIVFFDSSLLQYFLPEEMKLFFATDIIREIKFCMSEFIFFDIFCTALFVFLNFNVILYCRLILCSQKKDITFIVRHTFAYCLFYQYIFYVWIEKYSYKSATKFRWIANNAPSTGNYRHQPPQQTYFCERVDGNSYKHILWQEVKFTAETNDDHIVQKSGGWTKKFMLYISRFYYISVRILLEVGIQVYFVEL